MDDLALLREYAANNSEAAFAELVSRRIGFVYAAALRQVRDPHLAEEITQAVFIILAQKAGRISDKTILAGWLFKTTRFAAIAQTRDRAKRQRRELEVFMQSEIQQTAPDPLWEQMSPLLDEALATLGETDRQAVLLRFFENKSIAEVGNKLGMGEDTARKRVSRALEKLHRFFSKRGVSSTTAIIAGAISANSVQAAPVALAKSVTAVAIAKGAAASGSTLTLIKGALKIMAWTKAKTVIVVGVIALTAASTTTVVVEKVISINQNEMVESILREPAISMASLDQKMKQCPPVLVVRTTHYPNRDGGLWTTDSKGFFVGANMPLLLCWAYEILPSRIILPGNFSAWQKYDYLNNLPNGRQEALREQIKRKFGLVAHTEMLNTNVLLLKIRNKALLQSHLSDSADGNLNTLSVYGTDKTVSYRFQNMTMSDLAGRIEGYIGKLVVGGDDSSERYSFQLQMPTSGRTTGELAPIIQEKLEQLGFEFVPTNMPIEMLVVEKVK
jgi:uncharacterized protein (TIGR03435 family)